MRPTFMAAFLFTFALLAASVVVARAQEKKKTSSEEGTTNATTQRVVREGMAIELSVQPLAAKKNQSTGLMEEDDAVVRFKITDGATNSPVTGSRPTAWIDARNTDTTEDECKTKIRAFVGGDLSSRPEIDLNAFYVLALNDEPSISVVDPLLGYGDSKLLGLVMLKSPGEDWALSKDHRRLFVSMPIANQVAVIDTGTWKVIANIAVASNPARIALQPDEKYLWVGCDQATAESGVTVIDVDELRVVARIPTGAGHHEIVIDDKDRFAFVTNKIESTLSIIDVQGLKKIRTIKTGGMPTSLAFSSISKAVYVVSESDGAIAVIGGNKNDVVASIKAEPGVRAIRFAPGGRRGFVVNPAKNVLHILDAATNRIVQTADVEKGPYEVTFTETLAYVRSMASEIISMIPLEQVGHGGRVPLADFTSGQSAIDKAARLSLADTIAPVPDGPAVLVANPSDKTIYYYKEGMAATMGGFQNYGRQPRAVLVVNRSLRESSPGVYSANVKLTRSGKLDVALLLDSPRVMHCFEIAVKPNPAISRAAPRVPIRVQPLIKERQIRVGEETRLRFKVTDWQSQPKASLKDMGVLTFLPPGIWQDRQWAKPLGEGVYEVTFTATDAGVYYVFFQCPSLNVRYNEIPYLMLEASNEKVTTKEASRK